MAGMGPPPKDPDKRARRNRPPTANVTLPREGRKGPPPEWPMGLPAQTIAQEVVWAELWASPQAAAWEMLGAIEYEVAEYVLALTSTNANAQTERRQLSDRLGLNPLALRRLGWELARDDVAEMREGTVVLAATPSENRFASLRAVAK